MSALINNFSSINANLEVHSTSKMNVLSLTSQYPLRVGETYAVFIDGITDRSRLVEGSRTFIS
jgi:hypothetical protein